MANETARKDENAVPVLTAVTDDSSQEIRMLRVNPATGRLLVSPLGGSGGTGTWYSVSGTINGSNPTFTLPLIPASDFVLILGGQTQIKTKWYTVSGSTITYQAGYIPIGIPTDEHVAFVIS